jgi:D-amino-acid dehydrogenase
MHVMILGAGVIGVTTAYYLARAGHQVTLIDRQAEPGVETSFANAGEVSPGLAAPWAAPGMVPKAIKWYWHLLTKQRPPLVIYPTIDLWQWRWLIAMLANCTVKAFERNKERMQRLSHYSRACLEQLRKDTGIAYDERMLGTLQLFRTEQEMAGASKDTRVLERLGIAHTLLDVDGCLRHEPGLSRSRDKIVGGLLLSTDETGDCFKFTQALSRIVQGMGVTFRPGVQVHRIDIAGGAVQSLATSEGTLTADAYVLAAGSYSPLLMRPHGVYLPIYPVKGYSVTMPIVSEADAPTSTVMDERHKVAITRLGDRIRAAGIAEISGYNNYLNPDRCETVIHSVADLYPAGGDLKRARFWCGLRPLIPDGTPLVGASPFSNLYFNTGHGTLGWTMSCGSGKLIADVISRADPEIDTEGFTLERYA